MIWWPEHSMILFSSSTMQPPWVSTKLLRLGARAPTWWSSLPPLIFGVLSMPLITNTLHCYPIKYYSQKVIQCLIVSTVKTKMRKYIYFSTIPLWSYPFHTILYNRVLHISLFWDIWSKLYIFTRKKNKKKKNSYKMSESSYDCDVPHRVGSIEMWSVSICPHLHSCPGASSPFLHIPAIFHNTVLGLKLWKPLSLCAGTGKRSQEEKPPCLFLWGLHNVR